jgi:hypothetical protein
MKYARIPFFLLVAAVLAQGCKPDYEGELGEATDKVKGLSGTWELEQFIVQDPNNPVLEERDLSEFYIIEGVEPMRLTLNVADKSFTVTNTAGRNPFGTQGTWQLDDEFAPSSFELYGTADTVQVELASLVLSTSNNLGLIQRRGCASGFKSVVYKYNFKRVQ